MKQLVLILCLVGGMITATQAQKFAYVDTDYILSNIPEYKAAQDELDATSVRWQKEIETKYAEIDSKYKAFQAEQILLTEEMKRKREDEIIELERQAKEFQRKKFGVDGELFKKRQELIKPIQDQVYEAIKEIANTSGYAIIFDKANQSNVLYANPKYNKSDDVLRKLGITPGKE